MYIDEVSVFGDLDPDTARRLVERVAMGVGHVPVFAPPDQEPCGPRPRCLARRSQKSRASAGARATLLELAGETSVAITWMNVASGSVWRHQATGIDVDRGEPRLVTVLAASMGQPPPGRARRTAAWSLAATSAVLAASGAVALWEGHTRRQDFAARHVGAAGNIVGTLPANAQRAERSARAWSSAGGLLLAGAAASAVGATILVLHGPGERPRPAGLAVGGSF